MKSTLEEKPRYWQKEKKWYYFDPRYMRYCLTDEAPLKAIQDYLDNTIANFENGTDEELAEKLKQQILDYQKNKNKYTFSEDEKGVRSLIEIKGETLQIGSKLK